MIFLFLLRRLSARTRLIVGGLAVIVGLALVGASLAVPGLLIHGIATTVIGGAVFANGKRSTSLAAEPEPTAAEPEPSRGAGR